MGKCKEKLFDILLKLTFINYMIMLYALLVFALLPVGIIPFLTQLSWNENWVCEIGRCRPPLVS